MFENVDWIKVTEERVQNAAWIIPVLNFRIRWGQDSAERLQLFKIFAPLN
jgi:hypothetical protein